jgi:hypothetical protein
MQLRRTVPDKLDSSERSAYSGVKIVLPILVIAFVTHTG